MSCSGAENRKIRVLLVDDCPGLRAAVSAMLKRLARIELVGVAQDGQQALQLVELLSPDLVVTDLEMPVMDGAAFVREQMARRPLPIILFSGLDRSSGLAQLALAEGARFFLRKPASADELMAQHELLQQKILDLGCLGRNHESKGTTLPRGGRSVHYGVGNR